MYLCCLNNRYKLRCVRCFSVSVKLAMVRKNWTLIFTKRTFLFKHLAVFELKLTILKNCIQILPSSQLVIFMRSTCFFGVNLQWKLVAHHVTVSTICQNVLLLFSHARCFQHLCSHICISYTRTQSKTAASTSTVI